MRQNTDNVAAGQSGNSQPANIAAVQNQPMMSMEPEFPRHPLFAVSIPHPTGFAGREAPSDWKRGKYGYPRPWSVDQKRRSEPHWRFFGPRRVLSSAPGRPNPRLMLLINISESLTMFLALELKSPMVLMCSFNRLRRAPASLPVFQPFEKPSSPCSRRHPSLGRTNHGNQQGIDVDIFQFGSRFRVGGAEYPKKD